MSVRIDCAAASCCCLRWAGRTRKPRAAQTGGETRATAPSGHFTDIRSSAGITFVQDSTQTEEKYYLETMGTGVAWLDYDQDGLMDLYLVQSGPTDAYKPAHPLRSALSVTMATVLLPMLRKKPA